MRRLPRARRRRLDRDASWRWIAGWDLVGGGEVLVPYDCVTLDTTFRRPPVFDVSSNGLASGNVLVEAIVHGVAEVIERDAEAAWRREGSDRRLVLDAIADPTCRGLIEAVVASGARIFVWDLTGDRHVAVIGCAIVEDPDEPAWRALGAYQGFGAHVVPEVAIARAVTEAAQTRIAYIAGGRDDLFRADYARSTDAEAVAALWQGAATPCDEPVDVAALPRIATRSLGGDLAALCAPYPQVIAVDLTLPGARRPGRQGDRAGARDRGRMARMKTIVFVGPTLPAAEVAAALPDARVLPPAAVGDVLRASRRARRIALVDGYFEHTAAVWHKEILVALERGVHVFGAASMGALRAAELAVFGMRGVGRIYAAFAAGRLVADDEVAVAHLPAEHGFRPVSDALVNIRFGLAAATWLAAGDAGRARIELARARFLHRERSWAQLDADARRAARLPRDGSSTGSPPGASRTRRRAMRARCCARSRPRRPCVGVASACGCPGRGRCGSCCAARGDADHVHGRMDVSVHASVAW